MLSDAGCVLSAVHPNSSIAPTIGSVGNTYVDMADINKTGYVSESSPIDMDNADISEEKRGTFDDQKDMFRMGKAQEMRVRTHLQ